MKEWLINSWNNAITIILAIVVFLGAFINNRFISIDKYLHGHIGMTTIIGAVISGFVAGGITYLAMKKIDDKSAERWLYSDFIQDENKKLLKFQDSLRYINYSKKELLKDNIDKNENMIVDTFIQLTKKLQSEIQTIVELESPLKKRLKEINYDAAKMNNSLGNINSFLIEIQSYITSYERFENKLDNQPVGLKGEDLISLMCGFKLDKTAENIKYFAMGQDNILKIKEKLDDNNYLSELLDDLNKITYEKIKRIER